MVKILLSLLLLISPSILFAQGVKVSAEVSEKVYANQPFHGTVMITHNENQKIDPSSFRLGNDPLQVDLVKETRISPNEPLVISIYHFDMKGQSNGLHALPAVGVNVGGQVYYSTPTTYEALSGGTYQPIVLGDASLKLETYVKGSRVLYPGERTIMGYRFIFNTNVGLSKEDLPLLEAKGLIKIGDPVNNDTQNGNISISDIAQEVQAGIPGTYVFAPSVIEGYAYTEDQYGNRSYSNALLRSETEKVVISVLPFPEQGKPGSFNGAVGKYTFQVKLLSPSQVDVGDEVSLGIEITGSGNMDTVSFPNLSCQPEFSGMFLPPDLPPAGKVTGNTKSFTVMLRPITSKVTEIPSIEFSYFDTEKRNYEVLHSKPIPLTVRQMPSAPKTEVQTTLVAENVKHSSGVWPTISTQPAPIEIESNEIIEVTDLYNLPFGTWYSLWLLPFGVLAFYVIVVAKHRFEKMRAAVKAKSSKEWLEEAHNTNLSPSAFYRSLNQALLVALVEKRLIPSSAISPENLPLSGIAGDVRNFLYDIEEKRFTGKGDLPRMSLLERAQLLWKKIGGAS